MKPSLKDKLKGAPFVVDWDEGERYYQYHIFENAQEDILRISSKINKEGKVDVVLRGPKGDADMTGLLDKPGTAAEFKEIIDLIKNALEKFGYSHRFVDLSNCKDAAEAMQLLAKSDPRFEIKIKHKDDLS